VDVNKLVSRLDSEASVSFAAMALSKSGTAPPMWFTDEAPWLSLVVGAMAKRVSERRGRTISRLRARILRLAGLPDGTAGFAPGQLTRLQGEA
jgi:hypothetical protein